jgi:hypothetical protein
LVAYSGIEGLVFGRREKGEGIRERRIFRGMECDCSEFNRFNPDPQCLNP